jgi:nitrogen regulatory protein PII 1
MKMIRAIVRPERAECVTEDLQRSGIVAMTRWDVTGRGRHGGVRIGSARYDELAKVMLMVVVEDDLVQTVVGAIVGGARTCNPGDGRVFISDVSVSYNIRTGEACSC